MDRPPQTFPAQAALHSELQRGERVLWQGARIPRFQAGSLGIWLFAIPWTAFAVFWTTMAARGVSAGGFEDGGLIAWAFPLFGTPFIAIGLAMMAGPFLPLFGAGRTLFAITDQRLLEITKGRKLRTRSVPVGQIGMIERTERADGSGTLRITLGRWKDSDGDNQTELFELGEVVQVREAEQRLREAQRNAARISSSASSPSAAASS